MPRTVRPTRSVARTPRPIWASGVLGSAVVAGAVVGGSAVLGGPRAAASAAVGLVLVAIFFLIGRLPVLVEKQIGAGAAFLFLGLNYFFRVVLLLVALLALRKQPWVEPMVTGLVVIFGALGWNALELRRYLAKNRAENMAQKALGPESPGTGASAVISSGGGGR